MKKRWSILSTVLCVALLTGGCGTGSKNDAGTGKKQTFSQRQGKRMSIRATWMFYSHLHMAMCRDWIWRKEVRFLL